MRISKRTEGEPLPQQEAMPPSVETNIRDGFSRGAIPAYILATLPAMLGFTFIQFGIIYTGSLRPLVFEISWLMFGFAVVITAIISKASIIGEAKLLPRAYHVGFILLVGIWIYTAAIIAPSPKMANYYAWIGVVAVLIGLSSSALQRQFGKNVTLNIAWAFFVAMLLHAPFLIWLYALEGQNPDFNWPRRLPGYPFVRMYNYSVEAGIAAGLGLFYLSEHNQKLKQLSLFIGITLLWMLLFWSGGRGAFFGLLATTLMAAAIVPHFIRKMWKVSFSTITLGAVFSLFLPVPESHFGIMSRIDRTFGADSLNELSTGRLTIWSDAFEIFLQRPLFGHGVAQYPYLTTQSKLTAHEHVHNILLESLVSFGLIGTIAIIFLLGKIWGTALLRLRNTSSASTLPVFLVATTLLVHGFVSGTYHHIHSVFMIAISFGFLLQSAKPKHVSK